MVKQILVEKFGKTEKKLVEYETVEQAFAVEESQGNNVIVVWCE